jgi:hypothetical protein
MTYSYDSCARRIALVTGHLNARLVVVLVVDSLRWPVTKVIRLGASGEDGGQPYSRRAMRFPDPDLQYDPAKQPAPLHLRMKRRVTANQLDHNYQW